MKRIIFLLLAAVMFFAAAPQYSFATPAIPVDRDEFSIGSTITAEFTAYGVKSRHTGYKEDNKNAKIFYTRQGMADPAQPLRFILSARQSLPGTVQELEFTAQPYDVVNRYAGKKMERFYRKVKGSEGKKLNLNVEYKIPPKARLLVVTAQLKDYYKEGNKMMPRYTTVEYELRVVGYAEANANPLSGKSVKKVKDGKGKRIIVEDKHTDAITAAIGIGGSVAAGFIYWLLHRRKKNAGKGPGQQEEQREQNIMQMQQEEQREQNIMQMQQEERREQNIMQPQRDEQPHFCSNCGAKLKPDSRFCENCGTKV